MEDDLCGQQARKAEKQECLFFFRSGGEETDPQFQPPEDPAEGSA
jgi:hypothetical protein